MRVLRRDKQNRIHQKLLLCLSPLLLVKETEHSNQGRANLCEEKQDRKIKTCSVGEMVFFLCVLHMSPPLSCQVVSSGLDWLRMAKHTSCSLTFF